MQLWIRALWRVCTLGLVVGAAYLTTFVLFPYFNRQLPFFPSVLLGYAILAYVLLPFVSRFWRLVFRPNHIPRYAITGDGWPADPINIAIVARSKRHFIRAMKASGWHVADKSTLRNDLRELWALVFDRPYPNAPFSNLYLFGRSFDIGFQQSTMRSGSPRSRHHVRFWQLIDQPESDTLGHFSYWQNRFRHLLRRKHRIWIGAAVEDKDIRGFRWRNLQITHSNHADHAAERDYILGSIEEAGFLRSIDSVKDGEPFEMRGQNIGTTFIVDGDITVIILK
ncbi:LssY C-terminal domain-containing protein [Candidatus Saccharibacteria bacterium]|nr:LssY C-terminal domain-containing protein [Candidatus Saccharibacteria bacterium]